MVDDRDKEQIMTEFAGFKAKFAEFKRDVYKRLEALEKSDVQSAVQYQFIIKELGDLHGQLNGISEKLDGMRDKPAKRWDAAVTATVTAVVGTIAGAIVTLVTIGGGG